jgi:hypothetical protein
MFKTNNRANHEQSKVQPRKLTAEFENAKSPVQFKPAQRNKEHTSKQPSNNFNMAPQRRNSDSYKPSPHNNYPPTNKALAGTEPGNQFKSVLFSKPETPSIDDEDMISSDDDDEIFRQADLVYLSQSSQDSKIQERAKNKQLQTQDAQKPPKPLNNIFKQTGQSISKVPVCKPSISVNKLPVKTEKSGGVDKENVAISDDGFSDSDSFDDLDIDEAVLEKINAQNTKQKGTLKLISCFISIFCFTSLISS